MLRLARGVLQTGMRFKSTSLKYSKVKVSRRGVDLQVGLVELDSPDTFNTLCPVLVEELASVVEQMDADSSVRCLVITGSERVFSVGADVTHLDDLRRPEVMRRWGALGAVEKPTIAAVNGVALGGGCELAMMCDVIYAGERARFGHPEVKLALLPGAGGTQRLTRAIGKSRAMEMILSGKAIPAKEAAAFGLVSCVYPVAEVVDRAIGLAERISAHSLVALKAVKRAVGTDTVLLDSHLSITIYLFYILNNFFSPAYRLALDEGLNIERELFLKTLSSSRTRVSLIGVGRHSIRWHSLPIYSDINERSGVSVAIHGHTLYVFGGRTDNETAMNDLSTFDLLTVEWKRLTTNGAPSLCLIHERNAYFCYTIFQLRTLVINDLYSFCRGTKMWRQILKDTEGPRLRGHYNGAFLPPVASDPETHPGLLVLFEASDTQYLAFGLVPDTGFWFILPHCPQNTLPASNENPLLRPPMCALSEKDVLILTHHPAATFVWVLSRRARTPDSASYSVGWTWTEVQLRTRVNKINFLEPLEALGGAQLVCLPKLPHQEWPTVVLLRRIRFSTVRAHLNRRLREGPRRLPDVGSMSSSSSSPPSVTAHPETQPNPLVQVFDELHDPTQPAGAPGQPLRGAIIRRVASSSSSSSLTSLLRLHSTAASRKRRSSQVSGNRFASSMTSPSSDEPESDSDTSDPNILALCTLTLSGRPSRSRPCLMLCEIDGPSDQDYHLDSLPLSRSFAAFTYGLGSLLVFGVPQARLVNAEYMNGTRDKRPFVWAISGSRVVCGFEAPAET
ncbi:unnamed protein product [Hydatigera taeniaeformis]|uniref:Enoyl-CoA hydratase n=1 Tax=Hydatigena taeniaeformis TaxID=6205 RepID=A0A0R3WIG6_HYDTA|nr:unnamed protein product [Hydatigera taeniaeformis]